MASYPDPCHPVILLLRELSGWVLDGCLPDLLQPAALAPAHPNVCVLKSYAMCTTHDASQALMQEAGRLLDARLPIPAYGQLLRLSQAFNVLDARGVVGVTERATCFAAMRGLARRVARALPTSLCPTVVSRVVSSNFSGP